ncbi:MAG: peptidoglycan recognition family protein, partial [Myxococcota bacterium]|nr:peptidoglycan recognition family protein [Myxococcota bacterium]
MPRNRPKLLLLLGALLVLLACGDLVPLAPGLVPPESQQELLSSLEGSRQEAAASELGHFYDLPPDLLLALAWSGSSFVESDPEHGECSPRYAWLGLSEGQRLRASELTGLSVEQISEEREAGMVAGAALLDELRREIDPSASAAFFDARWWPVVVAFADSDDEWIDAQFALEVFSTLQRGFEVEDGEGQPVVLVPREIPGLSEVLLPNAPADSEAREGGSGYPARSQFLAAHSSNYSNRSGGTSSIDSIVIHTIEGSHPSAVSWFRNPASDVSAHYVVKRSDGAVTQMVYDEDRAWHATNYNNRSIGIEHEGHAHSSSNWTEPMLEGSARLAAWLATRYGIPVDRDHFIGHSEVPGSDKSDPGSHFPWERYLTMVRCYQGAIDCD